MRFSVLQESFDKALNSSGRLVTSRGQLPILSNVLIEAIKGEIWLSVTNLEMGIRVRVEAETEEEGALTIPAKSLSEYVGLLDKGKIVLESNGDKLKVSSGKSSATFSGIAASDFPVMPKFGEKESRKSLKIGKAIISEVARQVAFAAATEEGRPVLTGTQFKGDGKELTIIATDGFRMSRKRVLMEEVRQELNKGLILPAKTFVELSRVIEDGKKESVYMEVVEENNQVIFEYGDVQLISRILEGNFPEVEKIIPQDFKTTVTLGKDVLARAIKATAVFARESSNIVRWNIVGNSLVLSANASQSGESEIEIEIEKEGEDGTIAFNYRYVADFLNSVEKEEIFLRMNSSLSPGVFGVVGDENFVHLIMPVRV